MTVVLIPGAWHGPSCWDLVRSLLTDHGIDSVAVDLPHGDPAADLGAYVDAVIARTGPLTDTDVVIAHSMGGLIAPLLPAGRLILLTSLIPEPGLSAREQARQRGTFSETFRAVTQSPAEGGGTLMPAESARALFYNRCTPDIAEQAAQTLVPQCWTAFTQSSPLAHWPAVPTTVVVASDDRVLEAGPMTTLADMINAQVCIIEADHSPMLSAPADVVEIIVNSSPSNYSSPPN